MRVMKPVKILSVLCVTVFVLASCQKDVSSASDPVPVENTNTRSNGFLFDNASLVQHVPLLVSADYGNGYVSAAGNEFGRGKDTDRDGIPDSRDACPTTKEVINGFQDNDGCPDSVPAPADADGDGITDASDSCPTQPETINGYNDQDGCPDTAPPPIDTTVLPPPPATLPSSFELAMPPVGNQGQEFSCVAWAVSTARGVEKYYTTGATSYSAGINIFSPEYLYNQVKFGAECSSGTGLYTALNFLKNQGISTWQSMPYSSTNGCSLLPTSQQNAEAANFRITSFAQVLLTDVQAIKTLLTQKHALIAGTSVDPAFTNAGPGFIWNSFSGSYGANHGYVICGYDDARQAYKVINSWGTTWGDSGYSWIDYTFFGTLPGSLYVITGSN